MAKKSAGILLYRFKNNMLNVLLVHPGGPFYAKKDKGAWTIPKGEFEDDENALDAAKREFKEECGTEPGGTFIPLTPVKQKSGKMVFAWAVEGNIDTENIVSNSFKIEWPPKSGVYKDFPEIDKAGWFTIEEAEEKILPAQFALVKELRDKIIQ